MRIILITVILFFMAATATMSFEPVEPYRTDVYFEGYKGYKSYRIPALTLTKSGAILAFIEARKNGPADSGDIDLVVRRSSSNGISWDEPITIYDGGADTIGNPVPILDRDTGNIVLLFTKNNQTVHVTTSTDEGLTWGAPVDITSSVKLPGWQWYATGPGHGIQLAGGRLLAPADHSEKNVMHSHVIFSDDHGATWQLGGSLPRETDEATALELADGRVYINMRNNYFKGKRASAISDDQGKTWGKITFNPALTEPICEGSALRYSYSKSNDKNRVLFSNPSSKIRKNMTVKLSYDETKTWPVAKTIDAGLSGYSDMVLLKNGSIGLLYENGKTQYWEKITFVNFTLDWLTDGKDK